MTPRNRILLAHLRLEDAWEELSPDDQANWQPSTADITAYRIERSQAFARYIAKRNELATQVSEGKDTEDLVSECLDLATRYGFGGYEKP